MDRIQPNCVCTLSLARSALGRVVNRHLKKCNMVTAPDLCQNLVLLNILRTNGQNSNKFCMDIPEMGKSKV